MNKSFLVGAAASALLLLPSHCPAGAAAVRFVADAAPAQSIDFSVKLPLRNSAELDRLIHLQSSSDSPLYHHFLKPAQFRESFGPTPATFAKAAAVFRANGFAVTRVDSQMLHVRGTSASIDRLFGTQMGIVRDSARAVHYAARTRLIVPPALVALGAKVSSLAAIVRPKPQIARASAPLNRYSDLGLYWFDDLKQAYQYPAYGTANGTGVTVATVGLSDFSSSDATAYFAHEGLGKGSLAPAPTVLHVVLEGSLPFDPSSGASLEADVDVQQAGGSAPGATVVGVSFGDYSEFLDTYAYLDEANFADIVSTSYGDCELYYTAAYNNGVDETDILDSYHDLFRQGNSQGITFLFASGDYSGTDCLPAAYFGSPASAVYEPLAHGAGYWVDDPNVTGVGGTNLVTTDGDGTIAEPGPLKSKYFMENAIADRITSPVDLYGTGNYITNALWGSGGGPSSIFAKPSFQNLVPTGYGTRTVPDVSMHMGGCPFYGPGINVNCDLVHRDSGDLTIFGGALAEVIGSSASSPEFAGLLAVRESITGSRMGNANEEIYKLAAANKSGKYFHQGIYSYNGIVHVPIDTPGYTPIVGVGTPIAKNFVGLPDALVAGDPLSATNP